MPDKEIHIIDWILKKTEDKIAIGKSRNILDSNENANEIIILSFGSLLESAINAGEKLNARVVDMQFIKPIDHELIQDISDKYKLIVTLEDNVVAGGAGSAINEFIAEENIKVKTINFGISDHFPSIGGISEQRKDYQLDKDRIVNKIKERLSK